MNKRNLLNLVLALFLAGLVTLVVFQPGKNKPAPKALLTTFNPSDIQHIVVEQTQQPRIELKKHNGEWKMVKPFSIAANPIRVGNLLAILGTTSLAQYKDNTVDLAQLKLDKPDLILYLDKHKLSFGTTEALAGNRYVQIGNVVHLIQDRFTYLIRGPATSLISPALIPKGANLTALNVPGMTLTSTKNGWHVEPDKNVKSADQVNQLLDEWRYARAIRVTKISGASDSAPKKVINSITVKMADKTLHFELGRTKDEILFSRLDNGLQYHFQTDTGEKLLKLPTIKLDNTKTK
jgi:hypothetical protein